ncbi:phage major capsid protein [Mesorhizobium sp. B2-3-4]|uniref:phage major capsid family protein n=1 Tax=Mesorhizobium sp. B2-3-4 TaxID=2589959 RepID=UPI001127DBD3|nr:phage major capsid protein [Mesorhizobium sp. B2-3-4]TPM41552.1 phage major capsid protein [Mesorhizobium sp. B2-3-4]
MTTYRTTASAGEGMDFVISDGSLDRHGTRINPKGWVLASFNRNPIALFGHSGGFPIGRWENLRMEADKLVGRLVIAAEGTSARIDELRKLVEQGILRAVSAGFNVLEYGVPGKSDFDFEKQELIEASLVSVGSNTNALAKARELNISEETLSLAFGEHADTTPRRVPNGEHAEPPTADRERTRGGLHPLPKAKNMSNLAQRITDAQTAYNTARDAYQDHVGQDDYDLEQAEALKEEMEGRQARLTSLKDAERALGATAGQRGEGDPLPKPANRRPLGIREREPKPGDLVIRAAVCTALAKLTNRDTLTVLEERYRDHEATNVFVRAAVDPAKTTVSGWASELIETETIAFLETLRDISFYPRLAALGANLQFGPGRGAVKIPSRAATPSISGSFVGEGSPIPVRRFGLTSTTLTPHKMGVISYFTKEMGAYSTPQIENLLRQEIRNDTAETVDTLLTDANAGSTTRPAGLLNGVAALTASTDGGWAAIMQDIDTLAAPFDAAKAGRQLVLLMNKREARKLAFTPGPDKVLGSMRQILTESGITPISSVNVPAGRLIMIDAADFATSADDQPVFDVSEEAVFHAEDTSPQQISTAGAPNVVAAPVISMFQTASIALRMLMDMTWAMRRAGMVQWIDGADWSYTP